MLGDFRITQAEPAYHQLDHTSIQGKHTFSRTEVLLVASLLITFLDDWTISDEMLTRGITDSTGIIGRRDSGSIGICLSLLWTESDIVVGLIYQLCRFDQGLAYRITDFTDVAWRWFVRITSFRSVLRWFIRAFLDPVLSISSLLLTCE